MQWIPVRGSAIPDHAEYVGHERDGTPLFIARVSYMGGVQLGKAGRHLTGAHFSYGNEEVHLPDAQYEVLANPGAFRWQKVHCYGSIPPDALAAGRDTGGEALRSLREAKGSLSTCDLEAKLSCDQVPSCCATLTSPRATPKYCTQIQMPCAAGEELFVARFSHQIRGETPFLGAAPVLGCSCVPGKAGRHLRPTAGEYGFDGKKHILFHFGSMHPRGVPTGFEVLCRA